MCILFIYRNPKADSNTYRLILASNRDEDINRPTKAAHYWKNHSGCLGGMDMEPGKEGGTWLALSTTGKAGVILNLVNENETYIQKKGRGSLVTNFVISKDSADSYLNKLHKENQDGQPYNSHNLVFINLHNANVHFLSSSPKSTGPALCHDTILGFGNSDLETPYRKVEGGKEKFKRIVQTANISKQDLIIEELCTLLKSKERYLPDPELKRRVPTRYESLSSIFVTSPGYSTRTHSILLVNGANEITFVEETLMPDSTWKRQVFNNNLTCQCEYSSD